jgi:hypothetical protein
VSDPLVTTVRAPSKLEIWSAAKATPPPIPQISTVSPCCNRARVVSMRHAVSVASEKDAAWGHGMLAGTDARFWAGTTMYSAAVPG